MSVLRFSVSSQFFDCFKFYDYALLLLSTLQYDYVQFFEYAQFFDFAHVFFYTL